MRWQSRGQKLSSGVSVGCVCVLCAYVSVSVMCVHVHTHTSTYHTLSLRILQDGHPARI